MLYDISSPMINFLNTNSGTIQALSMMLLVVITTFYAIQTYQTVQTMREVNLRPVLLRSGFVASWDALSPIDLSQRYETPEDLKPYLIQFSVLKNIANDIQGEITLDGFQYKLRFYNEISKVADDKAQLSFNWGWMKPDTIIFAVFTEDRRTVTDEENSIVVRYKDVEGNEYYTKEDKNFSQQSGER